MCCNVKAQWATSELAYHDKDTCTYIDRLSSVTKKAFDFELRCRKTLDSLELYQVMLNLPNILSFRAEVPCPIRSMFR
jgi:hypothetical protein